MVISYNTKEGAAGSESQGPQPVMTAKVSALTAACAAHRLCELEGKMDVAEKRHAHHIVADSLCDPQPLWPLKEYLLSTLQSCCGDK